MKNLLLLFISCTLIYACQNSPKVSTKNSGKNLPTVEDEKINTVGNQNNTVSPEDLSEVSKGDERLQGFDISHYQTNIDWNKVTKDQMAFVFIKATAGKTFVDPSFKKHWSSAKQAGIMRGAYHFYYTKDDPTTQAKFFISNVLALSDKNDLPPVIDIETGGINTDISTNQLQKDIHTFLGIVEEAFDRIPILYTSHAFAQEHLDNTDFDKYYLWLAEYDDAPDVPTGWKNSEWTFWQNSPSATVNGVENQVDHDFFNGSMEKLKSL